MRDGSALVPQAVLVAAGGGGLGSTAAAVDDERQHGKAYNESRAPSTGMAFGSAGAESAGPGGGWRTANVTERAGLSLEQGGLGGRGCKNSSSGKGDGGFGGGGGGCAAGGGGGGWAGGNAWSERSLAGEGGVSAVLAGALTKASPAAHEGAGQILVIPGVLGCDCAYRCIALNVRRSLVQCICPPGWRVNGNKCMRE